MALLQDGPHDGVVNIPSVRYHRPDGRREDGHFQLPYVDGLWEKYLEMQKVGIEITVELFGQMVNVCFDDGEFDYKFFLWPNGPELGERLTAAIMAFTQADYEAAKEEDNRINQ